MAPSNEILPLLQWKHTLFYDPLVIKALKHAMEAQSYSQYVETSLILAEAGASKYVVSACLLINNKTFDGVNSSHLQREFGDDVANLVKEVSRLTELGYCVRDNHMTSHVLEPDYLQTLLLAMVDVRAVFIKLAHRLHTMRTLTSLPPPQQQPIANETLEIFAPLASRLGICSWKAELEDLCFMHLYPREHKKIEDELSKNSREFYVMSALKKLDDALRKARVCVHDLSGRSKSLYSIYTKMLRKARPLKEIFDVRGLRVVVRDVPSCFMALEIIHELWPLIPGKQKDYINNPKHNGYESLHTTVMGEDEFPLEVQIRTIEMHHNAESGMAAHWRYKEGDGKCSSFLSQRVEWARWMLSWQSKVMDSNLRISPLETDLKPPCPFAPRFTHLTGLCHLSELDHDFMHVFSTENEKLMMPDLSLMARDLRRAQPNVLHNVVLEDMMEFKPYESMEKCRENSMCMYGETPSFGDMKHGMFEVSQAMRAISN